MIRAGGTVIKDPDAEEVFQFDWGTGTIGPEQHLAPGVLIATSLFFIIGVDSLMTKDNEGIVMPQARATQLRLKAGTELVKYKVTNRIVTNEPIPQTKDVSFYVLIRQR
ncbi:MAG TPA: hypothetical protein VK467_06970 [Gemmatimonadales bacterium]|nr:hypothetical protein [Gemmatimonadales bacterium]